MAARRAIIIFVLGALWAAFGCTGAGTPEETLEAFHGDMAAKDFARAAELASYPGAGSGREESVARLAETYDADDFDYGRAEIRERRRLGPDEVEFTVTYPRRSRPSTPPATRRVTLKKMRGRWFVILEAAGPAETPKRPE